MGAHTYECALCPAEFISERALEGHRKDCPAAALLGTKRSDPGRALELLVLDSARALAGQGLRLDQVGAPHRILRMFEQAIAKVQLLGKGPLDFVGHLRGRYVTLEAKSVAGDRLQLNHERGVKPHQMKKVQLHHEDGAIAFVLVEFRRAGEYYALTWPMLMILTAAQASSASLEYCRKWAVPVRCAGALLDLVGVVRELMHRQAIVEVAT